MKKRWLVMITSLVMAVILCFSFAACEKDDPETPADSTATVKTVESAIKMMYAEKNTGSQSYTVAGRWRIGENKYCDITWTATAKTENITIGDYVTIGTRDNTTYDVPITIKQGTVDITYTLSGAFTIDGANGKVEFEKTIPAAAATDHAGTAADPYSVADAIAIAKLVASDAIYSDSEGVPLKVYITGYVTNVGKHYISGSDFYMSSLYIADEVNGTPTLQLFTVAYGDAVTKPTETPDKNDPSPLAKGDQIVIYGYIKNYKGTTPEVDVAEVDGEKDYPTITTWTKGEYEEPAKTELKVLDSLTAATTGTYYMAMLCTDGAWHYPTGEMSGYYMATTTDHTKSKQVTLAGDATNGYTIVFDGKYVEIIKSTDSSGSDHYNAKFNDTQTSGAVWKWDDTNKTFYMEFGTDKYVLGTTGSYDTISTFKIDNKFNTYHPALLGTVRDATAQEKANDVVNNLKLSKVEYDEINTTGIDLPTSKDYGATVVWSIKGTSEHATVTDNKLKINSLPATGSTEEVTLEVKATIGTGADKVEATKEIKITIEPKVEIPANAVTVKKTMAEVATANSWKTDASANYSTFKLDDQVTVKSDIGADKKLNNNGKCYTTKDVVNWRLYYSEGATLTISVPTGYKLVAVTITWTSGSFSESIKSGKQKGATGTSVTFNVASNIQITDIEVVYVADTAASAAQVALLPRKDA